MSNTPSSRAADQDAPASFSGGVGGSDGPGMSEAAGTGAARLELVPGACDVEDLGVAERKARAREAYLRSVDRGRPLSGRALGEAFGRSGRWGRDIIAAANAEMRRATAGGGDGGRVVSLHGEGDAGPGSSGVRVGRVRGLLHAPDTTDDDEGSDPRLMRVLFLLVGVGAMIGSWRHLAHVAAMSKTAQGSIGIDGMFAVPLEWFLPLSVDLLAISSAWKVRRMHSRGRRAGTVTYRALLAAVAMSLAGNAISSLDTGNITPPVHEWHPWAAVLLVLVTGLWMPIAAFVGFEALSDRGTTTGTG